MLIQTHAILNSLVRQSITSHEGMRAWEYGPDVNTEQLQRGQSHPYNNTQFMLTEFCNGTKRDHIIAGEYRKAEDVNMVGVTLFGH